MHTKLIEGWRSIDDKNALGWAVLDTKSETLLCAMLAVSINRRAGKRIAHVEYPLRIDLVILKDRQLSRPRKCLANQAGAVEMAYEAKAAALFTFAPGMNTDPEYLGRGLNDELKIWFVVDKPASSSLPRRASPSATRRTSTAT